MVNDPTDISCDLIVRELKKLIGDSDYKISREEILTSFWKKEYRKGDFFIREGEVAGYLGFIIKGLMKFYYIDSRGNEWIKHFAVENSFMTAFTSFQNQTPSLYNIEAVEDTMVMMVDYNRYHDGISTVMVWNTVARKFVERLYQIKEKREADFLKHDARERYQIFLEEYPHLIYRVSMKDIASYLGITSVTLSRIRNHK
ncbi:MAG: Crp/Fnr family transcriptional regulator [Candidatus Delongbacteria bacterium]|nr:Crp/Fnr family transcriptional regulator [Candidatus Delongbacteria bacterium]